MTIEEYVRQVGEALADLPREVREELLEDLPAHLAEIAADSDVPIEDRIGPPAAYASDLRVAANLQPAGAGSTTMRLHAAVGKLRGRLTTVDTKLGPLLGYPSFSEFARLLRPAWWVLRGYLAAMLLVYLIDDQGTRIGLLPRLGGSTLAGVVILAGAIAGSVWLARRTDRLTKWPRRALLATTVVLLGFGAFGFGLVDTDTKYPDYETRYVDSNPYKEIADVYVYDQFGNLVTNARLYDQSGRPIELGWTDWCSYTNKRMAPRAYPICPENAPFGPVGSPPGGVVDRARPSPTAGASPSATSGSPVAPTPTNVTSPTASPG